MKDDESVPTWRLIAVLQSTLTLAPALALRLYRAAAALHSERRELEHLAGDLGTGKVSNLRRELVLGTFVGPGFLAELDTPDGKGLVRFLLTREGVELAGASETEPARGAGSAALRGAALPN